VDFYRLVEMMLRADFVRHGIKDHPLLKRPDPTPPAFGRK
jgi:hypothetical protein